MDLDKIRDKTVNDIVVFNKNIRNFILNDIKEIRCKTCNQRLDVSEMKPGDEFNCLKCNTLLEVPQKIKKENSPKLAQKMLCGKCQQKFDISDMKPGSKFACPGCQSNMKVPDIHATSSIYLESKKEKVTMLCDKCQQKFDISDMKPGTKFACPSCNKDISIPLPVKELNTQIMKTPKSEERSLKIACTGCKQKLDLSYMEPFSQFDCPTCNTGLIVPEWFDNYLLEEKVGIGGMAEVYRTLDVALNRDIAIKILNTDIQDNEKKDFFLHEARTAATLNHYAVVPIFTCGVFDDRPYIVMQYMAGGSLEKELKELNTGEFLKVEDVMRWIIDIAEGLENAMRYGIIHHDIKPGNLMLDTERKVKLSDFGIAQTINKDDDKFAEFTKNWLSPHYVSPEKVKDNKEDARGDIYSLGATFYHLITGRPPFVSNDVDALVRMRFFEKPKPPITLRKDIPKKISELIMSMLEFEPDNRPSYQTIIKKMTSIIRSLDNDYTSTRTALNIPKFDRTSVKLPKQTRTSINLPKQNRKTHPKINQFGKTSWTKTIAKLMGLTAILCLCVIILWFTGNLNGIIENYQLAEKYPFLKPPNYVASTTLKDLFPQTTKYFALGDSIRAEHYAQVAFEQSTTLQKKRQAAIQLIIAKVLNKQPNVTINCSAIIGQLAAAEIDDNDESIAILRFFEKPTITDLQISERLNEQKKMGSFPDFIILLRHLYLNDISEEELNKIFDQYSISASIATFSWTNAWKRRTPVWTNCIKKSTGILKEIEPLFRDKITIVKKSLKGATISSKTGKITYPTDKNSNGQIKTPSVTTVPSTVPETESSTTVAVELSNLTDAWLAENRPLDLRPKVTGLDFNSVDTSYTKDLSEMQGKTEILRIQKLSKIKPYLCKMMVIYPYAGTITIGENKFECKVIATNDYLLFRNKGKILKLPWEKLTVTTYISFLEFYAKLHEKLSKNEIASVEYFLLGLLNDWSGEFSDAVTNIQKSVKLNPAIIQDLNKYILR